PSPLRPKKKKKKIDPIVAFAKKSLKDSPDIATETLAKLLIDQGYYEKAIEVYERLIAIHPEEKAKYQAAIENVKKRLT
ncbi:MAG: tetratricopeptide repeat protein, partial [Bacteroidota bacterium]